MYTIARADNVKETKTQENVAAGIDSIFHFEVDSMKSPAPDRAVPLGGNSLLVFNLKYRIADHLFSPGLVQYTFFLDGGDVWNRNTPQHFLKWTPGLGLRVFTPVGPVQVNAGYNRYQQGQGPVYYNPNVSILACATPGNTLTYRQGASTGGRFEPESNTPCPQGFTPPPRTRLLQKLTFTFSIGSDF